MFFPSQWPASRRSTKRLRMGVGLCVRELIPGELFVGGSDVAFRQAQFFQDDISRHRDGGGLEKGQVPVESLAAETAIGREHEFVGGNIFEAPADALGDYVGEV